MITKDTRISEIIEENPDSINLLFEIGLVCAGCALSGLESIGQGMRAHGFLEEDIEEVVKELNKDKNKKS